MSLYLELLYMSLLVSAEVFHRQQESLLSGINTSLKGQNIRVHV